MPLQQSYVFVDIDISDYNYFYVTDIQIHLIEHVCVFNTFMNLCFAAVCRWTGLVCVRLLTCRWAWQ